MYPDEKVFVVLDVIASLICSDTTCTKVYSTGLTNQNICVGTSPLECIVTIRCPSIDITPILAIFFPSLL